jgi:hypothetical protein
MRLETVRAPDALHRGDADPGDHGHGCRRPVRRLARRVALRQRDNALADSRRERRDARRARLSRNRPSTPSCMKRSCQRHRHVLLLPVRRMISLVPTPSQVSSTIRARHTCFWGLFLSAAIASRRARSATFTSTVIPVRMPQTRMPASRWESSSGLFRQIWTTRIAPLADALANSVGRRREKLGRNDLGSGRAASSGPSPAICDPRCPP